MSEIVPISPAALAVDNENPRIADEGLAQREAMRVVAAEDEGKLLLSLAEDIVDQRQLDPSTLPIIIPSTDKPGRYIVLEGNRRLVAIRALENPEVFLELSAMSPWSDYASSAPRIRPTQSKKFNAV
jgi:hypothetical protein